MRLVLDRNAGHWSNIDIHSKLDSPIHLPFHYSDSNAVSVSLYVCVIFLIAPKFCLSGLTQGLFQNNSTKFMAVMFHIKRGY